MEILRELRQFVNFERERLAVDKSIRDALLQMVDYLKEHQSVIDYILRGKDKQNQATMQEITDNFRGFSTLAFGGSIVTSDKAPLWVVNKSIEIKMAENSLIPILPNNAAYYRVGFLNNLNSSVYQTIDEGYPTLIITAQNLRLVSTMAGDAPGGTGIQSVLVGGLDSKGNRFFEIVALNGTNPVTTVNQFTQLDILNSVASGSNWGAEGTVSATNLGGTTTFGAIAPSNNAWYSGKVFTDTRAAGYIFQWSIASFGTLARFQLRVNHITGNINALITRSQGVVEDNTVSFNFPIPIKIPKSSLVNVWGKARKSSNEAMTAFELYTREDTLPANL